MPDGSVDPVETPGVVGNRTTTETRPIRFQASTQGVTGKSLGLTHPRNHLAYPLADINRSEMRDILREEGVELRVGPEDMADAGERIDTARNVE